MRNDELEEQIVSLASGKKWLEIIDLISAHDNEKFRRFLWVSPCLTDIAWIRDILLQHDLKGIISIGCGCGLLEWLIQQYTGLEVIGIEADRAWWQSSYSPPMFLDEVFFVGTDEKYNFESFPRHALLFCYFNNGPAFIDYMKKYRGNYVFVIGPDKGENRVTNPLPFDEQFEKLGWRFMDMKKMRLTKDCSSVYIRCTKNT